MKKPRTMYQVRAAPLGDLIGDENELCIMTTASENEAYKLMVRMESVLPERVWYVQEVLEII